MGLLLIKNTNSILVQGSEIEISEIYVRIIFVCNLDGSLTVNYKTYLSFDAFILGVEIVTNIENITYNFVITETEEQSLNTALLYMQNIFIEQGYNATITEL